MSAAREGWTLLNHLVERSGVIREPVQGRVDFIHRTFQEFLAAQEAVDRDSIDSLKYWPASTNGSATSPHLEASEKAGHGSTLTRKRMPADLWKHGRVEDEVRALAELRQLRKLALLGDVVVPDTFSGLGALTNLDDLFITFSTGWPTSSFYTLEGRRVT